MNVPYYSHTVLGKPLAVLTNIVDIRWAPRTVLVAVGRDRPRPAVEGAFTSEPPGRNLGRPSSTGCLPLSTLMGVAGPFRSPEANQADAKALIRQGESS